MSAPALPCSKKAIAAYYGLCSFVDDNAGKVLRTLEAVGLSDTTRVLYTSDPGDNLGPTATSSPNTTAWARRPVLS